MQTHPHTHADSLQEDLSFLLLSYCRIIPFVRVGQKDSSERSLYPDKRKKKIQALTRLPLTLTGWILKNRLEIH